MSRVDKKKRSVGMDVKGKFRKLKAEFKSINKPTKKEQFHGTLTVFVIAAIAAISISAVDSVFTALVGLFF